MQEKEQQKDRKFRVLIGGEQESIHLIPTMLCIVLRSAAGA